MSMVEAVDSALAADTQHAADAAVIALVRAYATAIDKRAGSADILVELGTKMLAALEALQLSPRARSLARLHSLGDKGAIGATGTSGRSRLDELRAARARKHGA